MPYGTDTCQKSPTKPGAVSGVARLNRYEPTKGVPGVMSAKGLLNVSVTVPLNVNVASCAAATVAVQTRTISAAAPPANQDFIEPAWSGGKGYLIFGIGSCPR